MKAAEKLLEIDKEDLRILAAVEIGMRKFQTVPVNHIKFFSRFEEEETQFRLDRAHKIGLLIRSKADRVSYSLNSEGYDVLALHTLFQKGIIQSVGAPLGRGKESDVYRCLTPSEEQVALKIHRLGQTSFRNVRRLRSFIDNRMHISWLYVNRLSATREFKGLKRVYDLHLKTPKPIAHNRHAVVMSIIQGDELNNFNFLNDPQEHFNEIIREYKLFYSKAHIIHGDLCEFNVLIDPDDEILIIDWPQWEDWNHPNAGELVTRDITNICTFFQKRFDIKSNPDEIIGDVLSLNPKFQSFNLKTDKDNSGNS